MSNKIKGNNETSKFFIGYLDNISGIVTPLCIILRQMSGWIKHFDGGGKNMLFKIDDDGVYIKYNQIWNKIKELLGIKFYSESILNQFFYSEPIFRNAISNNNGQNYLEKKHFQQKSNDKNLPKIAKK